MTQETQRLELWTFTSQSGKKNRVEQTWDLSSHAPFPGGPLIYSDLEQAAQYVCLDMFATLDTNKTKQLYFLYTSFTPVHLFLLQSLESHITKKEKKPILASTTHQAHILLPGIFLSVQDLLNIWMLRIQRTCLNSLLTQLLHFGKRITSTFQQKFSEFFTENCETTLKFCTHRFRSVLPFFSQHLPLNCSWTQQIHQCFQLVSPV